MVEPDASGPKEIEVTINNHTWIFIIERDTGAANFAGLRFIVSGVSSTLYMADPYAPKRSKVATNAINIAQAATEELGYTGFTLGWTLKPRFPASPWAINGAYADRAG
jgi:hypothetical protein